MTVTSSATACLAFCLSGLCLTLTVFDVHWSVWTWVFCWGSEDEFMMKCTTGWSLQGRSCSEARAQFLPTTLIVTTSKRLTLSDCSGIADDWRLKKYQNLLTFFIWIVYRFASHVNIIGLLVALRWVARFPLSRADFEHLLLCWHNTELILFIFRAFAQLTFISWCCLGKNSEPTITRAISKLFFSRFFWWNRKVLS